MHVDELLTLLDSLYPFAQAESWDHSGFLVGDAKEEIRKILLCLDVTPYVMQYAIDNGFNVLLSHHPLLFTPLDRVTEQNAPLVRKAIQHRINCIALHTNLDKSSKGTGYALCKALDFSSYIQDEYCFIVETQKPVSLHEMQIYLSQRLHTPVRQYGEGNVHRLCIIPGSGMDEWEKALLHHCDTLLTGDVKHHKALDALSSGINVLDAGHVGTEIPVLTELLATLQTQKSMLESSIMMEVCAINPYAHFYPVKGRGD